MMSYGKLFKRFLKDISFKINLDILCAIFTSAVHAQFWAIITSPFLINDRQEQTESIFV